MHRSIYPSSSSSVLDAYSIRILAGLLTSLALVTAVVNVPMFETSVRVGWTAAASEPPQEQIVLQDIETEPTDNANGSVEGAPPPTDRQQRQDSRAEASKVASAPESEATVKEPDAERSASGPNPHRVTTLDPSDREPAIVGGMGNLYVNIQYPKQAREQGIEGELKLEFTVRPDGSVRNVEVVDSLHPLCDSAAVEGVRSVKFVPAKHNGKRIPIRMKLPVRFRIITFPALQSTAGNSS